MGLNKLPPPTVVTFHTENLNFTSSTAEDNAIDLGQVMIPAMPGTIVYAEFRFHIQGIYNTNIAANALVDGSLRNNLMVNIGALGAYINIKTMLSTDFSVPGSTTLNCEKVWIKPIIDPVNIEALQTAINTGTGHINCFINDTFRTTSNAIVFQMAYWELFLIIV